MDQIDYVMLSASFRMRTGQDFTRTVRRGCRFGTRTVVLHAWRPSETESESAEPLFGFVVSKAVGSAVVRNRVKRRLRHLVRARLAEVTGPAQPTPGLRVVIRALPAAARQPDRLTGDLEHVWSRGIQPWTGSAGQRRRQPVNADVGGS